MREQKQTILDFTNGNCFATSLACILERPLEEIPNFCAGPNDNWFTDCYNWLKENGYGMISMKFPSPEGSELVLSDLPCIVTGHSPRNKEKFHCVVGKIENKISEAGFQPFVNLIHDPHPSNDFILDVVEIMIIVKLGFS